MDIFLVGAKEGIQILPVTIHGMLWLQTHFEKDHWSALAQSQVKLPFEDAKNLIQDAAEAGLSLNQLTELPVAANL